MSNIFKHFSIREYSCFQKYLDFCFENFKAKKKVFFYVDESLEVLYTHMVWILRPQNKLKVFHYFSKWTALLCIWGGFSTKNTCPIQIFRPQTKCNTISLPLTFKVTLTDGPKTIGSKRLWHHLDSLESVFLSFTMFSSDMKWYFGFWMNGW